MTRPLALAAVQAAPIPVEAGVDALAAQAQRVMERFSGTSLLVFPELHLFGAPEDSSAGTRLREAAEPLDGPRVRQLAEVAGDLGVWLIPGTVCERDSSGGFFNTAVVLSPAGRLVTSYRKIFVWRPYEPYDSGNHFVTFDIPGTGRLGVSICYDAWFPEVTRQLSWMGAEVILNLAKTTTADRTQEVILTRANAIVNQVFVVSVNCAGPEGTGQSLVVDPEGRERVHAPGASETVLTDVLDLDSVTVVRRHGTAGLNRVWEPFQAGVAPIDLEIYAGRIDPASWQPQHGINQHEHTRDPSKG